MTNRENHKLSAFVRFADNLASLSYCRRLKVGCLLVPADFTEVLAIGYNGPPAGLPNDGCRGAEGACGCVHGEASALVKLTSPRSDLTLVTTVAPCEHCAGLIINSGKVRKVVYVSQYRDPAGLELLGKAMIDATQWEGRRLCT